MNKSVSGRFFRNITLLLLIGTTILGFVFMYLCINYFKTESVKRELSNVTALRESMREASESITGIQNMDRVTQALADATDSIYIAADNDGSILYCTKPDAVAAGGTLGEKIRSEAANNGQYTELGELSGIFAVNYYSACCPVTGSDGQISGYLVASLSAVSLNGFLDSMLSAYMAAAFIMLVVSSVLSMLATRRLVTPLQKITAAARSFGDGDLTARAPVGGDDEVTQLAVTFNEMADKLEAVDGSRRNFMGNIAHELRTPMTTIKGFVDGMLDGTIPQDRWTHYLGIVSQEVGRLTRLIRSMLDITKLETGEYVIDAENYDLWETVSTVLFSREQQFTEHAIRLTGFNPVPVIVNADRDVVHQVIYNLVDNAIKFTPEGGTIDVLITENKKQGFVTFALRNTGEGIPEDSLPYLFERFYKADKSRSLHAEGSGLGLYISKQLIQRSGGRIWAESNPGVDATFLFTLPCGLPPKPPTRRDRNRP